MQAPLIDEYMQLVIQALAEKLSSGSILPYITLLKNGDFFFDGKKYTIKSNQVVESPIEIQANVVQQYNPSSNEKTCLYFNNPTISKSWVPYAPVNKQSSSMQGQRHSFNGHKRNCDSSELKLIYQYSTRRLEEESLANRKVRKESVAGYHSYKEYLQLSASKRKKLNEKDSLENLKIIEGIKNALCPRTRLKVPSYLMQRSLMAVAAKCVKEQEEISKCPICNVRNVDYIVISPCVDERLQ